MKRSYLDRILTQQSLLFVSESHNDKLTDLVMDQMGDHPEIKNICTKVTKSLSDRLDNTCALLNISKRQFCEMAFIEALDRANQIMSEEGVFEVLSSENPTKEQVEGAA